MYEKKIIWEAVIFGTILFISLGCVLISFIFLYQRKRYRHQQEMEKIQEVFIREMLHSKAEIQEQTLQHISSEIHDNFSPTLSVINLNLAGVIPVLAEPSKETIIDTKILVKQLMAEMKALSISLNTTQISRIGFVRALEQITDRLKKTGFYSINIEKRGDPYVIPPNKAIILLRMCQEALNNILKHAEADKIDIHIYYEPLLFRIEISDNGKGLDLESTQKDPNKQDSTGLQNMQNRAIAIGADLSIQSNNGKGTRICIGLQV